jgi:hypothetical protein
MISRLTRYVSLAILVLAVAMPIAAQETRTHIEGTVTDSSGAALPGVSVEALNERGQRFQTLTDNSGYFRFPAVPPGTYTVTASLAGMEQSQVRNLRATLTGAPRADMTMRVGAVAETLTVTAEAPIVDVTTSAVATSVTRAEIETLPRGRDFTDVVAFTPGATNDPTIAGGISIDGSTGLENRFIIDGIDTTDPQIGNSSVPMRAEFMEEIQVKTAGYAAEFGGSTGGVINAITRSGSNNFQGGLLIDYETNELNEDRPQLQVLGSSALLRTDLNQDDRTRIDPGFYIGGPILRDNLWFFGSYQPGITDLERTVRFANGVTNTFKQESQVDYATGNVTALLGSRLSLKAGFSMSPYETEGTLPSRLGNTTNTNPDNYLNGIEGDRETYSVTADFTATNNLVFSARGGYYMTDYRSTGVPFFPIIHQFSTAGDDPRTAFPSLPAATPPRGFSSDTLITGATARDEYERTSFGADGTWFLNAGGQHAIKLGFQTEEIQNDVQQGYNADRILYYWNRSLTTTTGDRVRGEYGYFRLLNISTLGVASTNNDAIFLQDSWSVRPNVTLNIGVRAENERIPNYGDVGPDPAMEFKYGDKIAPRLGFAWDPSNNGMWKIYGSAGTYYDVMKYELPRGSFGGDKWVDFFFRLDDPNFAVNNAATCRTGPNTYSHRPICPGGTLIEAVDRRHNAADPNESYIDPDLDPMELREWQLGADRQLATNMRVGVRYIHKEVVRAIEDVGILIPGVGEVYYIANPGYGLTTSIAEQPFPKAEREYDALELTFERRFTQRWGLNASYTYSKLWGNYTGLASGEEQNAVGGSARLSPNVSRQFDAVQSSYDKHGEFTYGRLASDRPHQFKAQAMYQLPWQMMVAVNQYVGSGTPKTELALVPFHNFFMPNGRGNLGRTPTLTQTDLALTQTLSFGGRNFQLLVNVLNVFDEDTPIKYWTVRNTEDLPVTEEQFFSGNFNYEQLLSQVDPDPAYNMADAFQAGRQVRLGLRFNF